MAETPRQVTRWLRLPDVAGAELVISHNDTHSWRVLHETYVFCACRTAASEWRYRGRINFVGNGDVALFEPGEAHVLTARHKPSDFKAVSIPSCEVENAAREMGVLETPHFEAAQTQDPKFLAAAWRFSQAVESGDTLLRQQSLFAECLSLLLAHAERKPRPFGRAWAPRAIERAKHYLQEKCCEAVTLDELAHVAGVSRFWLAHAFAKEVGLAPHAYQIHVRIARARALLSRGTPLAIAASELGFFDQSHFTRHFKRIMHVTPAEYARGL